MKTALAAVNLDEANAICAARKQVERGPHRCPCHRGNAKRIEKAGQSWHNAIVEWRDHYEKNVDDVCLGSGDGGVRGGIAAAEGAPGFERLGKSFHA